MRGAPSFCDSCDVGHVRLGLWSIWRWPPASLCIHAIIRFVLNTHFPGRCFGDLFERDGVEYWRVWAVGGIYFLQRVTWIGRSRLEERNDFRLFNNGGLKLRIF